MLYKSIWLPIFSILIAITGCGTPTNTPIQTANNSANQVNNSVNTDAPDTSSNNTELSPIDLTGLGPVAHPGAIELAAARNEWISFIVRIAPQPKATTSHTRVLKLSNLTNSTNEQVTLSNYRLYQILPVPIDVNRAGYVRHTGRPASVTSLPRALLPLDMNAGMVDLGQLRNPLRPDDRSQSALGTDQETLVWVDLQVPLTTKASLYRANLTLQDSNNNQPVGSTICNINVHDFVIPDERHLQMVGVVDWTALQQHFPAEFEALRPRLLNRRDPQYKSSILLLDQMMKLAQENRAEIIIPRLQPTVKWPAAALPNVDWSDFDSVIEPWLNGNAFADKVSIGFWPLPKIDFLDNYPILPRLQYWSAAAAHFDQLDWLNRAPVVLDKASAGRASVAERLIVSAEASRVMSANPRLRVMLPLEPDELQLSNEQNPTLIDPTQTNRLLSAAPGLISSSPLQKWPTDIAKPDNWLRTDMHALIPYVGAGGDESDVRVWAWMAFLRSAKLVQWAGVLPSTSSIDSPGDPSELVWFYPGKWFGTDRPVPTVQLKWLRRAQQDYEYLYLAKQRGSILSILPMSRVLTKPVEIAANQTPDPTHNLFIGTADSHAWNDAQELAARIVMVRQPGERVDENQVAAVNLLTLHWMEPLERPVILPRTTTWIVSEAPAGELGPWVNLGLGIDVYNASDTTPDQNDLRFDHLIPGWEVQPQAQQVPKLTMYQISRFGLSARIDPNKLVPGRNEPIRVSFSSGFTGKTTPVDFIAPVARSVRRDYAPNINGSLEDWVADDAIQYGPLVKMLTRPAIQRHELEPASTKSEIYSAWSGECFYIGFRLDGLTAPDSIKAGRNFIDYQYRRAWGEDLAQMVVQTLYEDGSTGPLLHIAVKPGGNLWVERKLDTKTHVDPWQPFEAGIRYAATTDSHIWRGELAIPWKAIINEALTDSFSKAGKPNIPVMLKFNFVQHKHTNGESASWAGPIDFGRDDAFTGVIVLKEPDQIGMKKP